MWFVKFFSGFQFWTGAFWGKVIWAFVFFMAFNYGVNFLFPKATKQTKVETIETYIEAPENRKVAFLGIKLWRAGIGLFYE